VSRAPRAGSVRAAVTAWLACYLAPPDPLIVACSGGTDSLALALATHDVLTGAPAGRRRLVAATVDHQLQSGSAGRARATADQLAGIGYRQVEVLTVQVAGSGGPEAAARRARYTALRRLAEQVGTPDRPCAVLLAHTADDQAETVLLGLARGSGPRSIAGMRPWRPPWGRPLLGVDRAATEATCRSAGLLPWQDPHNTNPAFTRVRLRREVLPLLDDVLGGGVRPALARTAELMAQDLRALDEIAAAVFGQVLLADGALDATALAGHPDAVIGRVLRSWVAAAGAGPLAFDHLDAMVRQVKRRIGPAAVRVPGGFDVLLEGGVVLRLRPVRRPG
jgi:tRNA(Ile)-lysidine synthase